MMNPTIPRNQIVRISYLVEIIGTTHHTWYLLSFSGNWTLSSSVEFLPFIAMNAFFAVATAMFPAMHALTTSLIEPLHQSSQPEHLAVSACVLLTVSHSLRAPLIDWSAISRVNNTCPLTSPTETSESWPPVGFPTGRERRAVNSA